MVESRGYERVDGPSLWRRENLVPLLAMGLLAALVGGAIALFFFAGDSGDEPPIRVKNGSIELQVLGNDKWDDKESTKHWKMKGDKERSQTSIHLTAAYSDATLGCPVTASNERVHLVYNDETYVTVDASSKKTHITAKDPSRLKLQVTVGGKDKVLEYNGVGGYIKRIVLGGTVPDDGTKFCEFGNKDQLIHLLLLDY